LENTEGGSGFLQEPLTRRERNILAHLAHDRSSQEIAGLEMLAYSSVKWYIHQIYAKLGVNRRREAIARANELDLLRPEPATLDSLPIEKNNLPRQLSSFIGREAEIVQLSVLVQELPLVTLTGSGGTGKTRLALQVASSALPTFADGAWWVDLTPLDDPSLVAMVAATALGMHVIPSTDALRALSEFIGRKHLLLILDNCEHLIGASGALARGLLHTCPHLHILATSREMLGVQGEKTFRCPPLSHPDPQSQPAFTELAQSEAVRLFSERAQNVSSGFRLTEANAPLVLQICQRLDGIPLAIELAAARVRLLNMEQIAARLDNVFHLLTGGGQSALARHQTLKALVDWSYDLLSEAERCLLGRLSVFGGSWTLEAAEVVCACPVDGETIPTEDILDLLGQLVDKSLVIVQDGPGTQGIERRYRMLEMIRQYAHHRLLESGGVEDLRERHLDYYLDLGLQAEQHLRRKGCRAWRERLEAEMGNLRLALEWSLSGSLEKGLRLAAALQWFWHGGHHRIEGVGWLNRLLAAGPGGDMALTGTVAYKIARGKALNASSFIGKLLGQDGRSMAAEAANIFRSMGDLCMKDLGYSIHLSKEKGLLECLEMFRKIDEPFFIGEMLMSLTQTSRWRGELGQARAYVLEGLQVNREEGDRDGEGGKLWELGMLEFLEGNHAQARADFEASQACQDAAEVDEIYPFLYRFYAWIALVEGDIQQAVQYSQAQLSAGSRHFTPWVMTDALGFLGWEAYTAGDADLAIEYCEKALNLTERPDPGLLSIAQYVLARVSTSRGEFSHARTFLNAFFRDNYHSWPPVQLGLQIFGIMASKQIAEQPAQARRAATLFGAQDAMQACLMNVIPHVEREVFEQSLAAVRGAMSAGDFAVAFAEGQAMTTTQAITYALEEG
jgi:predicted ATPase/DNA-binding CsgD family transcriptional regulator